MDIVLIVLAVIAVAVAAVLIIAALKPDTFSVQRSTSITLKGSLLASACACAASRLE